MHGAGWRFGGVGFEVPWNQRGKVESFCDWTNCSFAQRSGSPTGGSKAREGVAQFSIQGRRLESNSELGCNSFVMATPTAASGLSGQKLYEQRSRMALPLLVRQAQASTPIFYSDLAAELGMLKPLNLNYVLGNVGTALEALSKEWGEGIPPIQCLVVNKRTRLPGEGIGWFTMKKSDFCKLQPRQQRDVVQIECQKIFAFQRWHAVLKAFGLAPAPHASSKLLNLAAAFRGGPESKQHRLLKEYIATHPEAVHLSPAFGPGETEFRLPSGDQLDVLFRKGDDYIAVEVKSSISPKEDIVRGMYQCVKYKAVIEAYQRHRGLPQNARAILAIEAKIPDDLCRSKTCWGLMSSIVSVGPKVG